MSLGFERIGVCLWGRQAVVVQSWVCLLVSEVVG